jgi:hypothetical protein
MAQPAPRYSNFYRAELGFCVGVLSAYPERVVAVPVVAVGVP